MHVFVVCICILCIADILQKILKIIDKILTAFSGDDENLNSCKVVFCEFLAFCGRCEFSGKLKVEFI